jgi:hypothetical protein
MRRPVLLLLLGAALIAPAAMAPALAAGQTPTTPQPGLPQPDMTPTPPIVTTEPVKHDDTPGVVLLVIVAGALLALVLAWAVLRAFSLEPVWLVRGRHSFAEAGWRVSAAWAEFRDWLRIGR